MDAPSAPCSFSSRSLSSLLPSPSHSVTHPLLASIGNHSTSPPLPHFPMELKREILRFCDPSTLAKTSLVSLAFLELSSPLLYDEIELIGDQAVRLFFCERDETYQPQLELFLFLHRIRTLYISQDVFDDAKCYEEEERLKKERTEGGHPSESESDEDWSDQEEGATRAIQDVPQDKDDDEDEEKGKEFVFSKDRLPGGRPIPLGSLVVSIRGFLKDWVERVSPFLDEMLYLLRFFNPVSVEIFGLPPFLHPYLASTFPEVDIEKAPWTRLRRLVLHSCVINRLPPVVEGPLTVVCDSFRWCDAQASTASVYDFIDDNQERLRAVGSDPFWQVTEPGSRRDLDLVVQDDGRDASEIEEDFWSSSGVPVNEKEKWKDRVRFEVVEKGSPSLKMPHSGKDFPPFP